jgi:hypothetical protein
LAQHFNGLTITLALLHHQFLPKSLTSFWVTPVSSDNLVSGILFYFIFAESLRPLTTEQKVWILCEKITTTNTKLETTMTVIKMDETLKLPAEEYFVKAANKLAEQIVVISPNAKPRSSR